ncbi:hypothetical protein ABV409_16525 [Flagellimonas sp. DF-77]|uniref:hypothetical protein n=1 Tax=Flagellimonas algarum TaxID=3230298 RepID=UPI003391A762
MKKLPFLMVSFLTLLVLVNCGGSDESDDYEDCNCGAFSSIDIEFNGLQAQALEMINEDFFDAQVFVEAIPKERLVLEVDLRFSERFMASLANKGISSLNNEAAQRCSCAYPFNVINRLERLEVAMRLEGETNFVEVTDLFGVAGFVANDRLLSIEEALAASRMVEDNFDFISRYYLRVKDLAGIPDEATFRVRVVFMDESEFLQETQLVRFQ